MILSSPVNAQEDKSDINIEQYYEGSLNGLREYMDIIRDENNELFETLNPDLKILEDRKTKSGYIQWGLFLAGAIMITSSGSTSSDGEYKIDKGLLYGGTILGAGSFMFANMYFDEKVETRKFINRHNRLNKKSPLKFNVSVNPNTQQYGARLTYEF